VNTVNYVRKGDGDKFVDTKSVRSECRVNAESLGLNHVELLLHSKTFLDK